MALREFYKTVNANNAKNRAKKVVDDMVKRFGYQLTAWSLNKRLEAHRTKSSLLKKKEKLEAELEEINKKVK